MASVFNWKLSDAVFMAFDIVQGLLDYWGELFGIFYSSVYVFYMGWLTVLQLQQPSQTLNDHQSKSSLSGIISSVGISDVFGSPLRIS